MRIEKINVLRGPNYWSITRHHLIVMTLDLQEMEERPTDTIPGFYENLKTLLPSLYDHHCSEGVPGGFFQRVARGTWMGHVVEHIALELQTLAGMHCSFGQTRGAGRTGIYQVVFSYEVEEAGRYAAKAAVAIAEALIAGQCYDLDETIGRLKEIKEQFALGPSSWSLVQEAMNRNIPVMRLDEGAYVQLGYGAKQKRIEATITSSTGLIAVEKAGNKHETKKLLANAMIPVPHGRVICDAESLREAVEEIGFPVVIKPLDGNQGKGATTNIGHDACAEYAFERAQQYSRKVVVEKYIAGKDFRVLVIGYKFVAAAKRTPACVMGDGKQTIRQLIEATNKDPRRGNGHCNLLTRIIVDDDTLEMLARKNYGLDTVPQKGEEVYLKSTSNLSTGGTAEDVTEKVHPDNVALFERVARTIGLDICGIDVMAVDLAQPIVKTGGAVIEVNAAPGFRMHLQPTSGAPRNVAKPVIDMLFEKDNDGRIPVVAITGTNGKTTTTRLIAGMAQQGGFCTGYTTTEGIYLDKQLLYKGDCSGPQSAKVILQDSAVEFAVLETARGGILRNGLAFDKCSCAVVTNVAEDHLGLDGIDTLEKLARVKAVVAEAVMQEGYAVLNADDDIVYGFKDQLDCNIALFSLHAANIRIHRHCEAGGIAAVYEDGYIIIQQGNNIIPVEEVANIPITFQGMARFNIANALAASLAAYLSKISLPAIRCTLRNFQNTSDQAPGRMNLYPFNNFTLMLDYAHNPHGIAALGEFLKNMQASKLVGVIAGIGDRRNEDIIACGEQAAKIFDEIIIRMDEDLRGRTEFEISSLLRQGIHKVAPEKQIHYFSNQPESIEFAVQHAVPGAMVVVLVDNISEATKKVTELQEKQKHSLNKNLRLAG